MAGLGKLLGWSVGGALLGVGVLNAFGGSRLDLRGKVVFITGGSRGLGLLLARRFKAKGARLVLCARDEGELVRAREELERDGGRVLTATCDITDPEQVNNVVEEAVQAFGTIDVLVNNAGIMMIGPYDTFSHEEISRAVDSIFWGTVNATEAVLPYMRAKSEGTIVNVTSIGGVIAVPHMLPYTAGKFAAVGYSSGLQIEAARDGIRVVTVVPSPMRTGSFINAYFKGRREAEVTWFSLAASLPLLSTSAERAASRIIRATERGEPFVTIGLPAKIGRLFTSLLPGTAARLFMGANLLLPETDGGVDEPAHFGWQHRRGIAKSFVTRLGDRAVDRNNERPTHLQ